LGDNKLNTVRAFIQYQVTDAFYIRMQKPGASMVASGAENDPVQNLSYAYTGDLSDVAQIVFGYKAGANTFGATLTGSTPTRQTTDGSATASKTTGIVSGGKSADHENLNIELWGKLKFGAIGLNLKLNTASGTQYDDSTTADPRCAAIKTAGGTCSFTDVSTGAGKGNSYDSDGLQAHVSVPAGPASIKVDFETNTSDIRETDTLKGEYTFDYIGLLVSVAGLNVGFATETAEVTKTTGTSGTTETHINVHYRIPTGKGGWVGPELSMKTTADDTPGSTISDNEITTIRWLMVVKF
jgi:hypothetical protein